MDQNFNKGNFEVGLMTLKVYETTLFERPQLAKGKGEKREKK